ncbi:ABC transporter permease [Risungbinella massiliensis]|uniref:ABC transporter permease n=1 Tax=Risungbinella massiliensis TaxID=1329796 RepID=UPI0005CBF152|nr:ABC transporter permease [Risungbinella massiliensis]
MGSFLKKDLLVFWRSRNDMVKALLLPIVLIVVLDFGFSGLFDKDAESVKIDVAIVQEDDETIGVEQFQKKVQEMDLPPGGRETILEQAVSLSPSRLIHDFFHDPKFKDWVTVQELRDKEATKLVESGELDALITIPKGFTYDVLSRVLLRDPSEATLIIRAKEQSMEVDTLQDIVTNFTNTLNFQLALGNKASTGMTEIEMPQGGKEMVKGMETFTISQYFTIAMSTLFALFISQTVAMKTVTEKRERVFNRILLTNSNPLGYLMGKTLSTFCLTWLQMMITFTVTQLLLDVFPGKSLDFWFGFILVVTAFAFSVAGLSALFTTITLRLHDVNAANGLFTLIIMLLAVLGGSFFPSQALPDWFQKIGEWTSNGLTQAVLIKWIQFENLQDLLFPVIILIVFCMVSLVVSMAVFPRRGRI